MLNALNNQISYLLLFKADVDNIISFDQYVVVSSVDVAQQIFAEPCQFLNEDLLWMLQIEFLPD